MKPQPPHSPHRERRRAGDRAEEGVGMGGRGRGDLLETSASALPHRETRRAGDGVAEREGKVRPA